MIFLDESSINLGMTRLYGCAKIGERVNDYVPDVRFKRQSILSAVGLNGIQAPLVFHDILNGELFKIWVAGCLAPTLNKGDVVVMDNLSVHKVNGVIEPILARGATVKYLPPYSPDFNPIELMWSKVKAILKKLKARTQEALDEAIHIALQSVSINDISNWYRHSGYSL